MKKEYIEDLIKACRTEKQIINKLNKGKIEFENLSVASGYTNIRVYNNDGYIRIYKSRDGIKVQTFTPCKMEYSGIPTFFATNSYF